MKNSFLRLFLVLFSIFIVLGMGNLPNSAVAQAPDQHLEKVENKVLDALSTKGTSDYVIQMAEKADLSKAYAIKDWNERGWYVYNTLREVAARTQRPVIEILEKQGIKYQSFFAGNEIAVYGSGLSTLTGITSLQEVDHIRFPRTATIDPGFFSIQPTSFPQAVINALDWGITDTNADDFWAEFGVQGDGLVVANIDTGVQWDHPALDQSFKCGTNHADPACWADPSNICGASGACDNNRHGTHTMGTMVGDDDPSLTYQVGMAPNAQWIACKGCETNDCSDGALNACADWILAPNGSPANRPHIVNNSWGGGGRDAWYLAKVNSWRAAGIFPVFSAGNTGPTCGSIGSPGDYQVSFATANHTSSRVISSSSSRGPSAYGDEPYTKPNISAPGSNIISSFLEDGYASANGTSMAAPHVAGAVALLWSCNPSLIGDIETTFELLQGTADAPIDAGNCGAPADGEGNFTYGYGYLNAYHAGLMTCLGVERGTLNGHVYDNHGSALGGATVRAIGSVKTDATGFYTMDLPAGSYSVTASKYGYNAVTVDGVVIVPDATIMQDFSLQYLGGWIEVYLPLLLR